MLRGAGGGGGGGGGGGQGYPTAPLQEHFSKALIKFQDTADCKNFTKGLIDKAADITGNAAVSDNVEDLINTVQSQGGYVQDQAYGNDGEPINGTAFGGPWAGNATVIISPLDYASDFMLAQDLHSYLVTGLHETIHEAGRGYGDVALAQSVFALVGKDLPQKLIDEYNDINGDVNKASRFWNKILEQHCN